MLLNYGECSDWFRMEQGLRRVCILYAAVIQVTFTHFEADKDVTDTLESPRKKAEAGEREVSNSRRPSSSDVNTGILIADDAPVVL